MTKKTLKPLAFSLGLAAMTLTANNLNAQNGGGVFGRGSMPDAEQHRGSMLGSGLQPGYNIATEQFGSNTNGGYQIGTEQFGNDAPLGSGLFIMAAAGAAYAFKKRKKNN